MSRFQLKMLAVVTMLIDHTGAVLFPNIIIFRVIGRLSFPIFAFLIAEGFFRTSNIKAYLGRLFAFAVLSEVPYDLTFHGTLYYPQNQNIFFTLFIGLAAIAMLQEYREKNPATSFLLAGAFTRDILYYINILTTAVIPFARITFGIFIRKHTAHSRHNRR